MPVGLDGHFAQLGRHLVRMKSRAFRTAYVATAAAGLSLSLLTAPSPSYAAPEPTDTANATDSDDDGVLDAAGSSTAVSAADAEGKKVEDLSQRTESSGG